MKLPLKNRKDKNITDGNITSIRNEKANLAQNLRQVHFSWDMLRRPFRRNKHNVPAATMNGNIHHAQQEIPGSLAGTVPGKLHSNLSISAIAQRQHGSVDQHRTSTIQGGLEDSARQIVDQKQTPHSTSREQVAGRRSSIEVIGTKRISTHNTDGSRVSTKRIKKDEDGLRVSAELVQAENRERQLQKEVDELKAELKIHENIAKSEKAKAAQYMQRYEILQQEVQNNRRELLGLKEAAEKQEQMYREAIRGFDTQAKKLQQENLQLMSDLRLKEELLTEYRGDIARLSNEHPDSKRDDHYFEQNFSQLFGSIQSWVLQYYLTITPKVEDLTSLHPRVQEFLTTTFTDGQGELTVLQTEPLYTIQAYIASQIAVHVLRPALLGLMEDSYDKLYSVIAPGAGVEELTKWRISTINKISRTEEFSKAVSTKVEEVANELVASLATLLPDATSPRYKPGPRTRKLKAIVEQAAKLALEVQQEPSSISYPHFKPGTACVASSVSDAEGLRNEEELQAMGTFVRLTVYPAVVRKPYNCNHEQEGVVLVKAKVLAVEPGAGSEPFVSH
ncbi:hypothetical protein L211DRAFT_867100 [Terfezia boudieri ATCC MYA-4762]|uniref:Uncharacterized protein n=1 Tax=Terfezia boudieri ATCC MYA-4762 TaxID=1051890 RepID=A0A3N4LRQ5_9PEZI|nr:hypothetical protein L211DRAFT_867100 [Terfezia boudieri ATCC MYA-4762]